MNVSDIEYSDASPILFLIFNYFYMVIPVFYFGPESVNLADAYVVTTNVMKYD